MTVHMSDRCPTCGSAVRIVGADEGTQHYEADLDIDRLADAIDKCWAELLAPLGGQSRGLHLSAKAIAAAYSEARE